MMKRIREWIWGVLHPGMIITVLLVIGSSVGLCYVFWNHYEEAWFAYGIYAVSFYALCAAIASLIPAVGKTRAAIDRNPYANRYFGEMELRLRIKLYNGTVINLGYGIFQMVIGIMYKSVWFGALSVYYVTLSMIRGILVRGDRKTERIEDEKRRIVQQWKTHRLCGILLLGLNVTMSGIAVQMIWNNEGYSYPGLVIYAAAAYTFYRLTVALVRIFRKRGEINPVLSASKALDLSIAMMSILALQTAMFDSFGDDEALERLMNTLTGTGIFIIVICLALYMIVQSTIILIQDVQSKKM